MSVIKKWKNARLESNGCLTFFINKITLSLYIPFYEWSKKDKAIHAQTTICYRPSKDWDWIWAVVVRVLGFGFGIAYNHCENPNYDHELYKKYEVKNGEETN
jgi:hypothetical protein